jgi:hypothetical protein
VILELKCLLKKKKILIIYNENKIKRKSTNKLSLFKLILSAHVRQRFG